MTLNIVSLCFKSRAVRGAILSVIGVILNACAMMPPAGTRDHENWCYIQRHKGAAVPSSCDEIFAKDEVEREAERAREHKARQEEQRARQEEQRRWDEYAKHDPYGACVTLAKHRFKTCVAAVQDEAEMSRQQELAAQRHRDAAALLLASESNRTYKTPAATGLSGLANALSRSKAADHLRQGAHAPYDAATGMAMCRQVFDVDYAVCAVEHAPEAGGAR